MFDIALSQLVHFLLKYEIDLLHVMSLAMIIVGVIVFVILLWQPATYGRYSSTGRIYSFAIPSCISWFLQEFPAFFIPSLLIVMNFLSNSEKKYSLLQFFVLSLFILHYFHRTFIYSLKIIGGKPTPFYAFFLAFIFCSGNGYMQGSGALLLNQFTQCDIPRICIGSAIFFCGFCINIQSDSILRNLRKPGEKGYKIPRGGLFEWVSCANYTAEILEWLGYAIAAWTSVAFAFSFFTCSNLIPRAIHHHRSLSSTVWGNLFACVPTWTSTIALVSWRGLLLPLLAVIHFKSTPSLPNRFLNWYLEKFEDYPKERKAVLPYLV